MIFEPLLIKILFPESFSMGNRDKRKCFFKNFIHKGNRHCPESMGQAGKAFTMFWDVCINKAGEQDISRSPAFHMQACLIRTVVILPDQQRDFSASSTLASLSFISARCALASSTTFGGALARNP